MYINTHVNEKSSLGSPHSGVNSTFLRFLVPGWFLAEKSGEVVPEFPGRMVCVLHGGFIKTKSHWGGAGLGLGSGLPWQCGLWEGHANR